MADRRAARSGHAAPGRGPDRDDGVRRDPVPARPRPVPGPGPGPAGRRSGQEPPLAPAFLRYGSWIGADRDGNPHVTAEVTLQAAEIQADHALRALENAATRIGRALTVHAPELAPRVQNWARPGRRPPRGTRSSSAELAARSPQEPYREFLLLAAAALRPPGWPATWHAPERRAALPSRRGVHRRPAAAPARPGRGGRAPRRPTASCSS